MSGERVPVDVAVGVLIDREGRVRHVHRGYKPGDESTYADLIRSLVKE